MVAPSLRARSSKSPGAVCCLRLSGEGGVFMEGSSLPIVALEFGDQSQQCLAIGFQPALPNAMDLGECGK